jgi:hypothetical protein
MACPVFCSWAYATHKSTEHGGSGGCETCEPIQDMEQCITTTTNTSSSTTSNSTTNTSTPAVHRHRDLHDCVGVEWRSFFEGWNFVPYSDEDGERRLLDPDNEITSNRAMIGVWGSATVSDLYVPHGEQYALLGNGKL